ncbi:MAG: hypothetical protein P4M11_14480 [Candidatus Pacebacteria bacterium]|nr:hypothetical protein [Candidatus Paceibacterota bacterium]
MAIVYIVLCATSLLCASLVKAMGSRRAMTVMSALCWYLIIFHLHPISTFIAAFLFPGFCANLPGAQSSALCSYTTISSVFIVTSCILGFAGAVRFPALYVFD